jgi:hypothetical protein
MFAKVNVDIVNSMASNYGDILFNIRNLKNNQYLAQRDSWNLGKSAAAIRTIVNCLRDRSPTVATILQHHRHRQHHLLKKESPNLQ